MSYSVIVWWLSGAKTVSKKNYRTIAEANSANYWLQRNFANSIWQSKVVKTGYRYK